MVARHGVARQARSLAGAEVAWAVDAGGVRADLVDAGEPDICALGWHGLAHGSLPPQQERARRAQVFSRKRPRQRGTMIAHVQERAARTNMRTESLHALLRLLVASAGAGACASNQSGASICAEPREVIDRTATVQLSVAQACSFAWSASRAGNGGAAVGDSCLPVCQDPMFARCRLPAAFVSAYLVANIGHDAGAPVCLGAIEGGASVGLECIASHTEIVQVPTDRPCTTTVEGRRPPRLVTRSKQDEGGSESLGQYFAECARLEAASVIAFEILQRELRAHGAPGSLTRRADRAAADEIRHAKQVGALADKFGGRVRPADARLGGVRNLPAIAVENAVEGVVRETFGAALALWRAQHAADPDVRRTMGEIADDECAHAALAWDIAAWAKQRLAVAERLQIDFAMRKAAAELDASFGHEPLASQRLVAGVPSAAHARRLLSLLRRDLWSFAA